MYLSYGELTEEMQSKLLLHISTAKSPSHITLSPSPLLWGEGGSPIFQSLFLLPRLAAHLL